MIRLVRDWLLDIQSASTCPHDDHWYHSIVESPLAALREFFPLGSEEQGLLQRCEHYLPVLKGESLPYVVEHGDLGHPNLILTGHDSLGVIDWELAELHGLIAGDFFFFLGYLAFSRESASQSGKYLDAFEKAFFGRQAWALPHTQPFLTALGIRSNVVPALFLLCWLRYLVRFIESLQVQTASSMRPEATDAVRRNRYYAIWRYTVERFESLCIYAGPEHQTTGSST